MVQSNDGWFTARYFYFLGGNDVQASQVALHAADISKSNNALDTRFSNSSGLAPLALMIFDDVFNDMFSFFDFFVLSLSLCVGRECEVVESEARAIEMPKSTGSVYGGFSPELQIWIKSY